MKSGRNIVVGIGNNFWLEKSAAPRFIRIVSDDFDKTYLLNFSVASIIPFSESPVPRSLRRPPDPFRPFRISSRDRRIGPSQACIPQVQHNMNSRIFRSVINRFPFFIRNRGITSVNQLFGRRKKFSRGFSNPRNGATSGICCSPCFAFIITRRYYIRIGIIPRYV